MELIEKTARRRGRDRDVGQRGADLERIARPHRTAAPSHQRTLSTGSAGTFAQDAPVYSLTVGAAARTRSRSDRGLCRRHPLSRLRTPATDSAAGAGEHSRAGVRRPAGRRDPRGPVFLRHPAAQVRHGAAGAAAEHLLRVDRLRGQPDAAAGAADRWSSCSSSSRSSSPRCRTSSASRWRGGSDSIR